MRASLIQRNLIIVTVDIDDDNIRLVRFLHGIHPLVIIGPQNWGDFPSANNKEILQPYILIRTSTNPTSQTAVYCLAQRPITIHRHNEARIHTGYMDSYCVAVSVCHSVGWTGADGTSAGKNASIPVGTPPPAFYREPNEVWSDCSYWQILLYHIWWKM